MDGATLTSAEDLPPPTGKGVTRPCLVTPLQGSSPHALMFDITHDNESMLDKRSPEDTLSTGALVAFSYSAIGSNKGFDDLYPKLLNLVSEERRYEVFPEDEQTNGTSSVKRVLNHLHTEMVLEGYSEGHVHQENDVSLKRYRRSVRLVTEVAFIVHRSSPRAAHHSEGLYPRRAQCLLEGEQGPWLQ